MMYLETENIKVENPFELEMKRLYIPVTIFAQCPSCGEDMEINLDGNGDYLSYPTVNEKSDYTGSCDKCDEIYDIPLTLRMEVEYNPEEIRKETL